MCIRDSPLNVLYTGRHWASTFVSVGIRSVFVPLCWYATANLISSSPLSTSSFVIATSSMPLIWTEWREVTPSNHPQRRGRPVVAPNSPPICRSFSPRSSHSSVGNGPSPTRVQYAFATPRMLPIFLGGTPVPAEMPHASEFDDVTKG